MDVTQRTAARLQRAARTMPDLWDGRASVLAMKEAGYAHWKQMEWTGFYFQFLCEKTFADILDMPGPKYGRTEFDAFGSIPWDFKAHAANTTSHRVITNDTEAIEKTVAQHGYYGLILAIGLVEYNDEELTFKQWHDALKGGKSDYELKRIDAARCRVDARRNFALRKYTLSAWIAKRCMHAETRFKKASGMRTACPGGIK